MNTSYKQKYIQVAVLLSFFILFTLGFFLSSKVMTGVKAQVEYEPPKYLTKIPPLAQTMNWIDGAVDINNNFFLISNNDSRISIYYQNKGFKGFIDTPNSQGAGGAYTGITTSRRVTTFNDGLIYAIDGSRKVVDIFNDSTYLSSFPISIGFEGWRTVVDIAVDTNKDLYVTNMYRVEKYTSEGTHVTGWRVPSTWQTSIGSLYVDDLNNADPDDDVVYVIGKLEHGGVDAVYSFDTDLLNPQVWYPSNGMGSSMTKDTSGNFYFNGIVKYDSSQTYVDSFSPSGSIYGRLNISGDGELFVPVWYNKIEFYETDGTYVDKIGPTSTNYEYLAISDSFETFVTNTNPQTYIENIRKYKADGNTYIQAVPYGINDGEIINPGGIAIDRDEHFIAANSYGYRIDVYDASSPHGFKSSYGSYGTEPGQFRGDIGTIDVDSANNLLILDTYNHRIQKFSSLSPKPPTEEFSVIVDEGLTFNGLAIDPNDEYFYVTDRNNYRVIKYTMEGDQVSEFGSMGGDEGQWPFNNPPYGLEVTKEVIYVAGAGKVQVFDLEGNYLYQLWSQGIDKKPFLDPRDVEQDSMGNIYISDYRANEIQVFGYPETKYVKAGTSEELTGDTFNVVEGTGGFQFDILLTSPTSSDVTVNFVYETVTSQSFLNKLMGTAYAAGQQVVVTPSSLVFTPANWNVPQRVSVAVTDDSSINSSNHIRVYAVTSSSAEYYDNIILRTLDFFVTDNDTLVTTGRNIAFGLFAGGVILGIGSLVTIFKRKILHR